jgi:hypothetical protein
MGIVAQSGVAHLWSQLFRRWKQDDSKLEAWEKIRETLIQKQKKTKN